MNQKYYFLLVLLFISSCCFSQSNQELFTSGNAFYKEGKYKEALASYQKIETAENADVFFNMANCYYKLNKVAPAIYFYEKTLKVAPSYKEAEENLIFAKRMTIDVIEPLPTTFLQRVYKQTIHQLSHDTWGILAIVFSILFVLFFVLYYFLQSSSRKLWSFNVSILSLVLMICSFSFAYVEYQSASLQQSAIIFAATAEVKNAPTDTGDAVFELHEGTKVQLLDALKGWKKIRIANGKQGWISEESLKEI